MYGEKDVVTRVHELLNDGYEFCQVDNILKAEGYNRDEVAGAKEYFIAAHIRNEDE
jgi:hypothetical protein